jgi:hypothetical protein
MSSRSLSDIKIRAEGERFMSDKILLNLNLGVPIIPLDGTYDSTDYIKVKSRGYRFLLNCEDRGPKARGLYSLFKNSLIIHEENTKKNHKRVVSLYVDKDFPSFT